MTRNKRPPQPCFVTRYKYGTSPYRLLNESPKPSDRQILPQMCISSRASRPGLAVGILQVLCNGMCTAQRFHMEGEEQRCRAGCQDEPDSLSDYSECPLHYNIFTVVWRHAAVWPRRGHLFHNHHRRNVDNPGNFGDCIEGKIRFMTAIAPTYAHASRDVTKCFLIRNFSYLLPKPDIRILTTLDPQRAKKAIIFMLGQFIHMEGLAPLKDIYIFIYIFSCISRMQRPESTPTTPLSSRILLRRFLSLGAMAQLPVIHIRVLSMIPSTLPVSAWALSNHWRTFILGSHVSVFYCKSI